MTILFCDDGYTEARRRLAPLLEGHRITTCPRDGVAQALDGVDVIVPYGAVIDADIIRRGRFGLVQQFGVGLETVDVAAATDAGVWVARVPSAGTGNAESTAEHAIFLMMALARKWRATQAALAAQIIGEPAGTALLGKTACIVGLGGVGAELAKRLRAFGMRLIALRRDGAKPTPALELVDAAYPLSRMGEALGQADFVAVCARYEPATHNLVDRRFIDALKPGAFVVNIARGGLVDPDALVDGLRSGRIAGAGLDVFWREPPPLDHPLFTLNVVATPHIAGVTDQSYRGIAAAVADNINRFARGDTPLHAVNHPEFFRYEL